MPGLSNRPQLVMKQLVIVSTLLWPVGYKKQGKLTKQTQYRKLWEGFLTYCTAETEIGGTVCSQVKLIIINDYPNPMESKYIDMQKIFISLYSAMWPQLRTQLQQWRCGPLSFPQNAVEALQDPGIKDLVDWTLCQILPAHPHFMFRYSNCTQHPPPLPDPTYHQLVISSIPFTRVSRTHDCRSDDLMITKLIIDLLPRVSWCHVRLCTSLCLNMVQTYIHPATIPQQHNRIAFYCHCTCTVKFCVFSTNCAAIKI